MYTHKNIVVNELVDVVSITAIIHGILECCEILAMHVQHNVSDPVNPPTPQPQVTLEDAPVHKAPHLETAVDCLLMLQC